MPKQPCNAARLAKRCEPMFGGCNRCSFFSGSEHSSFIRPGRRFRARIIISEITSRRSIRRNFSDTRHTVGSEPNRFGGRLGCCFRPHYLILWAPGGFRLTCYYYRGAYYKAFWADPPACAVGEPRKKYLGERSFPLIMQNVHRYFLYVALIFIGILAYDVWKAMWFAEWIWNWRWNNRSRNQRLFARWLHIWLSLPAPSDRRFSRSSGRIAAGFPRLRLRHLFESPPHALGVDEFVLGRIYRSLRAALLDGHLADVRIF